MVLRWCTFQGVCGGLRMRVGRGALAADVVAPWRMTNLGKSRKEAPGGCAATRPSIEMSGDAQYNLGGS
jgi:hypothetical protein